MKKFSCFIMCMIFLVITGCASQTTHTKTPYESVTETNVRVIDGSLDAVWHAAVSGLSKEFFVLDNIEKSSKIITLSYGVSDPEPYVDCGTVTVTTKGGMSGDGTSTFPFARKMVTFTVSDGTPHAKPIIRTVKLSGKMNLVFTEVGKNKVQVAVSARYVLDGKSEGQRWIATAWSGYLQPYTETFSDTFNTGQPSDKCTAKNTLEKKVLDTIESELMQSNQ